MAAQSYDEKIKTYIKVAVILAVITVVEVGLTFVPHDVQPMKTIITMAIVLLSCSKAFFVAYYYMHLNHEQKWTKIVAGIPVIMLIYTAALIADMPFRPESRYVGEQERTSAYPTTNVIELQKTKEATATKESEVEENEWE